MRLPLAPVENCWIGVDDDGNIKGQMQRTMCHARPLLDIFLAAAAAI